MGTEEGRDTEARGTLSPRRAWGTLSQIKKNNKARVQLSVGTCLAFFARIWAQFSSTKKKKGKENEWVNNLTLQLISSSVGTSTLLCFFEDQMGIKMTSDPYWVSRMQQASCSMCFTCISPHLS